MQAQLRTLGAIVRNPQLRRLELAWMWTCLGVWGGVLALSVYAYDEGGAAAVGIMALVRALPGAPAAPVLALVVDRTSRRTVMLVSSIVRATIMAAAAAAVAADAPLGVVYLLAAALAVAGPGFRPALMALMPRAARTPGELASANVASSLVNNGSFFVGSLAVGVLLSVLPVETVFALLGGCFALAVLPLLRMPGDTPPDGDPHDPVATQMIGGWRAVRREPGLREPVIIGATLYFVDGTLDVLLVVAALGFLGVGEAGAGVLTATWGAGCVLGGAGVLALLGRGRLTRGILVGGIVVGAAVATLGLVPVFAVALVALLVFGVGYTLVEVGGATLLQRLTPDHVLGRVGGIMEAASVTALALGSLTGGLLAESIGARGAFIVVAVLVPVLVLARRGRLMGLEAGAPVAEREYGLLRAHPIFAPLSIADTERLARALEEVRPRPGATIMAEGDRGDRFYLLAEGQLDVFQGGAHCGVCGRGEGVGEIALIRDVPRTATVRARDGTVLLALDRDAFLSAVTRQPAASKAAHRIADVRVPAAEDFAGA